MYTTKKAILPLVLSPLLLGYLASCKMRSTKSISATTTEKNKQILQEPERPSIEKIMMIEPKVLNKITGKLGSPDDWLEEIEVLEFIEASTEKLIKLHGDKEIYYFARDAELVFDGHRSALLTHPQGVEFLNSVRLINVSKRIIENSSPAQLRAFLKTSGMDLDAVMAGTKQILWYDTSLRGTIFLALFKAIIDGIQEKGEARDKKIENLLTNVKGYLIASEEPVGIRPKQLARMAKGKSNLEIYELLDKLFFEEILSQREIEKKGHYYRPRSILAELEQEIPHWTKKASRLTEDGKAISDWEKAGPKPARKKHLRFQRIIAAYFNLPEIRRRLKRPIDQMIQKRNPCQRFPQKLSE